MKTVELNYKMGTEKKMYETRESALRAARRIAKKEEGISCEIVIGQRRECYIFDKNGNKI